MSEESRQYHVTLRWPGVRGALPEVMVNVYAAGPEALDEQLAEALAIVAANIPHLGPQPHVLANEQPQPPIPAAAVVASSPVPIRREPQPEYREPIPQDESPQFQCGSGHFSWRRSQRGGWYCSAHDDQEPHGFCRWIVSAAGELRLPQRKAATR